MKREVIEAWNAGEIGDGIIALVAVLMVDMKSLRNFSNACFPNSAMQAESVALKIFSAEIEFDPAKFLCRLRVHDDRDFACTHPFVVRNL